jgi:hypothetical protein
MHARVRRSNIPSGNIEAPGTMRQEYCPRPAIINSLE